MSISILCDDGVVHLFSSPELHSIPYMLSRVSWNDFIMLLRLAYRPNSTWRVGAKSKHYLNITCQLEIDGNSHCRHSLYMAQ